MELIVSTCLADLVLDDSAAPVKPEPGIPWPIDLSRTTFLIGAGVSAEPPSSIPTAARLMAVLCDWIAGTDLGLRARLAALTASAGTRRPYLGPYQTLRFELLLEWATYLVPELNGALEILDSCGFPNRLHLLLIDAVRHGARILTTNFDTRLEEAARLLGVPLKVSIISAVATDTNREAELIKLHGSFPGPSRRRAGTRPVGTLSQIARFGLGFSSRGSAATALREAIDGRDLVVSGYSAWDSFDIIPLLESTTPTCVLWHRWAAEGALQVARPTPIDPLLVEPPGPDPDEILLGALQQRCGSTWMFLGPSPRFFDCIWPHRPNRELEALATRLAAGPAECGWTPDTGLRSFQELLAEPDLQLEPASRGALVDSLEDEPYGVDGTTAPSADPPSARPATIEFDDSCNELRLLMRDQRCLDAAHESLRIIRSTEPRGDRLTYASPLLCMLQGLFWQALAAEQDASAAAIARLFRREALRYRQIWALVEADYFAANLALGRAFRSHGRRRQAALAKAGQLLDRVVTFALRIPRPAMLVDALRLLLASSTETARRTYLRQLLRVWRGRLPPSEERLLASLEILRTQVADGIPDRPEADVEDLIRTAAEAPELMVAPLYVALGKCFWACYGSVAELEAALAELIQLPIDVPACAAEIRSDIARLEAVLAGRRS